MSSQFLEIFSSRPKLIKVQPKIIADYREKNSLVIPKLVKLGSLLEIKNLKVGDYIANSTVVERKTIKDFLNSMKNKRLIKQIEELKQYKNKLLIIEGFSESNIYNESAINENAIRGFLLSISIKHNIPIIFTQDELDTAKFLLILANKKERVASLNAKKKALNNAEQMQFILESFPGIGPKKAKLLLKKFENLNNIFNASSEDLKKLIGKKAEIFNILKKKYINN